MSQRTSVNWTMIATRSLATVVALVAGYASYLHIVAVAMQVGERAEVAYALPVTIDALMLMSTLAMLAARRAGRDPSGWARAGFWFGVGVSVTCNIASAAPTWPARAVAAIPAVSLLLAVEVLVRAAHREPAPPVLDQAEATAVPLAYTSPVPPVTVNTANGHRTDVADTAVAGSVDQTTGSRSRTSTARTRTGPHRASGRRRTTPVEGTDHPTDRTGNPDAAADRADLETAARTVHAQLIEAGTPLNRRTLTEALRRDGRAVSNATAGQLLAVLRADQPANGTGPRQSDASAGGLSTE